VHGTLSYYPNLLVNHVVHRNGLTDTQMNDPKEMRRLLSLSAMGPLFIQGFLVYVYSPK
jgi:hypothetical protein